MSQRTRPGNGESPTAEVPMMWRQPEGLGSLGVMAVRANSGEEFFWSPSWRPLTETVQHTSGGASFAGDPIGEPRGQQTPASPAFHLAWLNSRGKRAGETYGRLPQNFAAFFYRSRTTCSSNSGQVLWCRLTPRRCSAWRRTLKGLLLYSLLQVSVLGSLGCGSTAIRELTPVQRELTPVQLVPSTSVVMALFRWAEVHRDDHLKKMVEGVEIEKLLNRLGLSDESVEEVIIFSDANVSAGGSMGMIVSGSYDPRTVVRALEAQGWTVQRYRGHELYFHPTEEIWLAPFGSGRIIAGTRKGVESIY